MRFRQCLVATGLVACAVTAAAAQTPDPERRSDRRPWVLLEPHFRRPAPDFFRLRMAPDRMRMLRLRGERELAIRGRLSDRRSTLRRGMVARERAMERLLDRLDQVRDQHRVLLRRRWRMI